MPRRTAAAGVIFLAFQPALVLAVSPGIPPAPRQAQSRPETPAARAPVAQPYSHLGWTPVSGSNFSLQYPAGWQVQGDPAGGVLTVAPSDGLVKSATGITALGLGLEAGYYALQKGNPELTRDTNAFIDKLMSGNPILRLDTPAVLRQPAKIRGLFTTFTNASPFPGETEVVALFTTERPQGLFCLILIAPRSQMSSARIVFDRILATLRF